MEKSLIGSDKFEINTPALLIDLKKIEYNLGIMADFFKDKEAVLRPHIKTHKTPVLAHKQLKAGAVGITCQKLAEAEVMADSGIGDILIANQIVGHQKIKRLVNLAKNIDIKVAVDNKENGEEISYWARQKGVKVGILVEVNIGLNRCGVLSGEPALRLAQEAQRQKGVEFLGLMGYEGHTVFIPSYEEREREAKKALELLVVTKSLLEKNGIECKVMSAGGTGTYDITGSYPSITEIQAGSYLTMDAKYGSIEGIGNKFKQALSLLTTVISRPTDHRAIIDAGKKAVTEEFGMPMIDTDEDGIAMVQLDEENGHINIENPTKRLSVGEKIELIPSHGCTTINLHDFFYGIRDGTVESIWPIEARGKFG
jgi:D-serine deaminase-like pyridoxal phosphate-dependent protein